MNTILILHGWGSCAKNWDKVKKLLEKRGYKVFVPDLPGFEQNPSPATQTNEVSAASQGKTKSSSSNQEELELIQKECNKYVVTKLR